MTAYSPRIASIRAPRAAPLGVSHYTAIIRVWWLTT
jgi:hypothetical protein